MFLQQRCVMRLWIILFSLSWVSMQADLVCSKGCTDKQTALVINTRKSVHDLFSELINSIHRFDTIYLNRSFTYPTVSGEYPNNFSYRIRFSLKGGKNKHPDKDIVDTVYHLGSHKTHTTDPSEYLQSGLLLTYNPKTKDWPVSYDGYYGLNDRRGYLSFQHPISVHLFLETLTIDIHELFHYSYLISEEFVAEEKKYIDTAKKHNPPTFKVNAWNKDLLEEENCLSAIRNEAQYCLDLLKKSSTEIEQQHQSVIDYCITHHQSCWAYYHRGFQNFVRGNFEDFLDDIHGLLEANKKTKEAESLLPYLYVDKGIAEEELGLYQQAISSLNNAIEKDPQNREAYFERAALYFETGQFDLSLADYLRSESFPSHLNPAGYKDFAEGLLIGARNGIQTSATEFIPSVLGSLRGVGNLIWATLHHPIDSPIAFAKATQEFFGYLRSCDRAELAELLAPEMHQLVTTWDTLNQRQRGELAGFCLGKYGTDILLPIATIKGFKYVNAYRSIRAADKLHTLEALASSPQTRQALIESATCWNAQRTSKLANVKIIPDLQNKHIPGKHNYKLSANRSIWTHPEPQQLLNRYAGTGQKVRGVPGQAGYKERVDFGEFIGYYIKKGDPMQYPTTVGTIHYNKKGAHIVPARPKK